MPSLAIIEGIEMSEEQIKAFPGFALIGMRPQYGDYEGQLIIPGSARSRMAQGRVGQVCSVTPFPEGVNSLIYERGKLVSRPAYLRNDDYTSLVGEYVVCSKATLLWGELYTVRLEFIDSKANESVKVAEEAVKRCIRCRSAGEANILLGSDGFCPSCGMNKHGEHIDDVDMRSIFENDDALYDGIIRCPTEVAHVLGGGKAISGRVISYPGQQNRGGNSQSFLSEHDLRILGGKN